MSFLLKKKLDKTFSNQQFKIRGYIVGIEMNMVVELFAIPMKIFLGKLRPLKKSPMIAK